METLDRLARGRLGLLRERFSTAFDCSMMSSGRPAVEEAAGLYRVLDPRRFDGADQPGSRIAAIYSSVKARTRHILDVP
jgi:hypothetical protein